MIRDFGAALDVLGGGGARGVAAGTGDNTAATGEIMDIDSTGQIESGCIVVCGQATLADTESISINDVVIEHGALSNLSDATDFFTAVDFADFKTSDGGTTETFMLKVNVRECGGLKQYWRVSVTPDLSASATDTFELGFGFVAMTREDHPANG